MTVSPGSQKTVVVPPVLLGISVTLENTWYTLLEFNCVIPAGPGIPCNPWIPCGPAGPAGPAGPCVPVLLSLSRISFLSLSLSYLLNLQNSTELTKNPSNGPVLHSYFLSSVGYWL